MSRSSCRERSRGTAADQCEFRGVTSTRPEHGARFEQLTVRVRRGCGEWDGAQWRARKWWLSNRDFARCLEYRVVWVARDRKALGLSAGPNLPGSYVARWDDPRPRSCDGAGRRCSVRNVGLAPDHLASVRRQTRPRSWRLLLAYPTSRATAAVTMHHYISGVCVTLSITSLAGQIIDCSHNRSQCAT